MAAMQVTLNTKSYLGILLFYLFLQSAECQNNDTGWMGVKKLRQKLLTGYDKTIRPVQHHSNMTKVNFTFAVLYSFDLNEKNETLTLDAFIRLAWIDPRWAWNPEDFGGIDYFPLAEGEAWLPDILIYESVPAQKIDSKLNVRPIVKSSGKVIWAPRGVFQSLCPLKFDNYPKTVHICNVTFGSWSQDSFSIDLQIGYPKIYRGLLLDNYGLELVDYSLQRVVTYRNGMPNPFVNIICTFQIRRKPSNDSKIVGPAVIVATVLMLIMFWLPPSADKKLTLGATALFILVGLLLYLAASIRSPVLTGVVVAPVRSVVYIVVSAILSEIFVIILTRLTIQPPEVLTKTIYGNMGKALCLYGSQKKLSVEQTEQLKTTPQDIWHRIAMAIDRIFFLLFIVIVIINQL